jgi:hypothetical protein
MRVMVCEGGSDADVSAILDKLSKLVIITGIVWGPDYNTSKAALDWWGFRFFAPNYVVTETPDVVVILPGATAIQRLREAIRQRRSVIAVLSDGHIEFLEGRCRVAAAWGIA